MDFAICVSGVEIIEEKLQCSVKSCKRKNNFLLQILKKFCEIVTYILLLNKYGFKKNFDSKFPSEFLAHNYKKSLKIWYISASCCNKSLSCLFFAVLNPTVFFMVFMTQPTSSSPDRPIFPKCHQLYIH
jgi:hypothetical protein